MSKAPLANTQEILQAAGKGIRGDACRKAGGGKTRGRDEEQK